jgi:hypothetical protein
VVSLRKVVDYDLMMVRMGGRWVGKVERGKRGEPGVSGLGE